MPRFPTHNARLGAAVCVLAVALGTGLAHAAGGDLDPSFSASFGGDGRVTPGSPALTDVLIRPDGKLLAVAGPPPDDGCSDFAVVRLNRDGSVDPGGGSRTDFGKNDADPQGCATEDVAYAGALQPNGKLVGRWHL